MSEGRFPWRTLFFVSLGLNLLTVGAVAGALGAGVQLQREAPQALVERMPGPRAFVTALPEEVRAEVRRELALSWGQSREVRQGAAQARREAFEAASAEPYDAARVRAAFARLRAADQASVAVFHNNIVDTFAELTPEQRRLALQSLRDAPPARGDGVLQRRRQRRRN